MRIRPLAMLGALMSAITSPFNAGQEASLRRMKKGKDRFPLQPRNPFKASRAQTTTSRRFKGVRVHEETRVPIEVDEARLRRIQQSEIRGMVLHFAATARRQGKPVDYRQVAAVLGTTGLDIRVALGPNVRSRRKGKRYSHIRDTLLTVEREQLGLA